MKKLSDFVGNTPLLPIKFEYFTIWGKAEFMNPGGSVKDRMATYIINDLVKDIVIYVRSYCERYWKLY